MQPKDSELDYISGFDNNHETEAIPGALPKAQNSPQVCPHGLYAEQISGTAFTVPRDHNQRSWLYRIRPSVCQSGFRPMSAPPPGLQHQCDVVTPEQLRWAPLSFPAEEAQVDFIHGLVTVAGVGDPTLKNGLAIHMYTANASMHDTAFQNSDGDLLIVPQEGPLHFQTEMGRLLVLPGEIVVIPRGIRFRVVLRGPSAGYVLEIYQGHFRLPELGPIGSNGLANARDFKYPVAAYEDKEEPYTLINKYANHLFEATLPSSPFNVVAWHGNYAPFKYNLEHFNTMNSVSFDHPDPSIYTVLTCPSTEPGVAIADFVIFPQRWMVMEHTFRPPYYHRNIMSEFMGMIYGSYDAKTGFQPGGSSLHSCMSPHGPDADTFLKATREELKPQKFTGGLAFMFETCYTLKLTQWALSSPHLDKGYVDCWATLPKLFSAGSHTMISREEGSRDHVEKDVKEVEGAEVL